ncbi:nucleotidyl transferase AbiEii/AbiGii toxin family protein [Paenibacillus ginsengarvi]|uniref:Nucleotidyl transferase AbiEii/AbiGii toxin family protein n=1 Tax=Paenibacillus ginsengarvi TaxID=400777 RepID=A0A3B0BVM1_9BACL|nr:nucleotidyl transferase AbiEii/AbiGii toxin family protein [Paenibacillus ginsengarvi]RKN77102.1 nucleotidyl transferase AbiEii/AbiGii toxin family protein [Paenibacillus ginsengarvi]
MSDIKNVPASVSERLKNVARQSGKAFDSLLLLYFQERFLYRLSISDFKDKFVLKGGLFLFSQTGFKSRPTKDADFLAKQIANDLEKLQSSFTSICSIEVPSDGVVYLVDEMTVERIKEDADYEGVRIKVTALLGRTRKVLQFDIGFGDVVVPRPQLIDYPVLLNMEMPKIRAYSKESVISEKFEAMISLSVMNSRMKDFYDIYTLLVAEDYDGRVLYEAVFETFQHRGTILEKEHPLFSEEFVLDANRVRQWNAFLKRTGINQALDFKEVLGDIVTFLEPIYQSVLGEQEFFGIWDAVKKKWSMSVLNK